LISDQEKLFHIMNEIIPHPMRSKELV